MQRTECLLTGILEDAFSWAVCNKVASRHCELQGHRGAMFCTEAVCLYLIRYMADPATPLGAADPQLCNKHMLYKSHYPKPMPALCIAPCDCCTQNPYMYALQCLSAFEHCANHMQAKAETSFAPFCRPACLPSPCSHFNGSMEHCGSPLCEGLTLTIQAGVYSTYAVSKYPPPATTGRNLQLHCTAEIDSS